MSQENPVMDDSRLPGQTPAEKRWDWSMRQFVDGILRRNMPAPEARRALLQRGVPHHVANRLLPRQEA